MRLLLISFGFITEFRKRDNCYRNYDEQQLSVIVDFTETTLPQSADVCIRGSILI